MRPLLERISLLFLTRFANCKTSGTRESGQYIGCCLLWPLALTSCYCRIGIPDRATGFKDVAIRNYFIQGRAKKKLLSCEKVLPVCAWLVLIKTGSFFCTSLYRVAALSRPHFCLRTSLNRAGFALMNSAGQKGGRVLGCMNSPQQPCAAAHASTSGNEDLESRNLGPVCILSNYRAGQKSGP